LNVHQIEYIKRHSYYELMVIGVFTLHHTYHIIERISTKDKVKDKISNNFMPTKYMVDSNIGNYV
jgi:hypothetical protein